MRDFPAPREPGVPQRRVLTVSRLNAQVRQLLEREIGEVWVEGEVSNLSLPGSGHAYFSLKDGRSQVKCALFRQRRDLLRFEITDGAQVLVRARVGLYEPRGDFQLVVQYAEEVGAGALQREFERVKQELSQAGLFDERHKRALPRFPQAVGIISSPGGAAVHDVITTIRRRCPAVKLIVYPAPVQGEAAVPGLIDAVRAADRRQECDVLILARGGGSLEDLHAFNDKTLARALFDCSLPIVSGVGHDVDFSIADFVCDRRAATPTGAAELVSPDGADWQRRLTHTEQALVKLLNSRIERDTQRLDWARKRVLRPDRPLTDLRNRLVYAQHRLTSACRQTAAARQHQLLRVRQRLEQLRPTARLARSRDRLTMLERDLNRSHAMRSNHRHQRCRELAIRLDSVSPLRTLDRGYALVTEPGSATPITQARSDLVGREVHVRLGHGRLECQVKKTKDE